MGFVEVIAGTIILTTFIGAFFDYLGKRAKAGGKEIQARVEALEKHMLEQDQAVVERDEQVRRLEGEVSFMTRLLESRTGEPVSTASKEP